MADLEGTGTSASHFSPFSIFMWFSVKTMPNNRLVRSRVGAPLWEILDPPLVKTRKGAHYFAKESKGEILRCLSFCCAIINHWRIWGGGRPHL